MKLFTKSVPFALVLVVGIVCTRAEAQIPFLDMNVSPVSQMGADGTSQIWSVQLANNTSDIAYLILTGFDDGLGIVPGVSVPPYDPSPFGNQFTLNPGDTLNLTNLFETDISGSAPDGVYDSTAEADYDLYDDPTFSNFLVNGVSAFGDWELTVHTDVTPPPAGTPEPSSIGLLAGSFVIGALCNMRRRRALKK